MTTNDKRNAQLAQKARLIKEIEYYEKRIEEIRSVRRPISINEDRSSDSEDDLDITINVKQSIPQLHQEQRMLKTCLQATHELTGLEILQKECNVLIEAPKLEGETPPAEPGTWREVIADCRVDLVPFTVTFFAHQSERKFSPILYRGLKVNPLKNAHKVELAKSVLIGLKRPSDAIEVIRNYASAYRSRRASLARLADKFGERLFMEPLEEGGYQLKAPLLEVRWVLQNKWSPIASFRHHMKFDIDYMDEEYVKTIRKAHRQLSDPEVDTDERTALLAEIISTCLEAQGVTSEQHESMSSDPETAQHLRTRRTTLDQEPDFPIVHHKDQLMAPPKTVPKRKSARRSNFGGKIIDDRKFKNYGRITEEVRISQDVRNEVGRNSVRTDDALESGRKTDGENSLGRNSQNVKRTDDGGENGRITDVRNFKVNKVVGKNSRNEEQGNVDGDFDGDMQSGDSNDDDARMDDETGDKATSKGKGDGNTKKSLKTKDANKNKENIAANNGKKVDSNKNTVDCNKKTHESNKKALETKKTNDKVVNNDGKTSKRAADTETGNSAKKMKVSDGEKLKKGPSSDKIDKSNKNTESIMKKVPSSDRIDKPNKNTEAQKSNENNKAMNKVRSAKKADTVSNKDTQKDGNTEKAENKNNEKQKLAKKTTEKKSNIPSKSVATISKNIQGQKTNTEKVNQVTNAQKSSEKVQKTNSQKNTNQITNKPGNPSEDKTQKVSENTKNTEPGKVAKVVSKIGTGIPKVKPLHTSNKPGIGHNKLKLGKEKENIQNKKITKIPQKNPAVMALKNNPLRMSPRRLASPGKLSGLVAGAKMPLQKTIHRPATNIPRLATKTTVP